METPDLNLWSPDNGDQYALVQHLAAMMMDVEEAIRNASPVGEIKAYGGATAPPSYLLCNGQAISRVDYADLFATIGTSYGAGNGSTTFNVPDLRGRAVVGLDTTQTEFNVRGKAGGEKTHTLTKPQLPAFGGTFGAVVPDSHTSFATGDFAGTTVSGGSANAKNIPPAFQAIYGYQFYVGSGQPHNNLQPYSTVNFIIRAS